MPLRFAEPAVEAYKFPLTIGHLLDSVMISSPAQEIFYRDQFSYTYLAFKERLGRLASLLTALGAEPGMTIAMMDWDSHRYLEAYFAVPMMGAVLQTVNVRLPPQQLAYTLVNAKAEILIVHRDFFPVVQEMLPSLPGIKTVIAIMDDAQGDLPHFAQGEYEALSAAADPDYKFEDFDENAVATTFFTTGTTGNPKGVSFTHRQLVLHTLTANSPFGSSERDPSFGYGDVYMPLTPMFHVHAWGMPYIATMLGVKQVYPGRYEPELICKLRSKHKVTYSHCVPTVVQMVFKSADETGADLSGWKMRIGGSALTKVLAAEGRRRGMNLVAGYGMSETCPLVALSRRRLNDDGDEEAILDASVLSGVPIPLVSAKIMDEAGNELPNDGYTRGELVLRAPWLTSSYAGDPAASAALWRGGWMHTQDIATIDAEGFIVIRDRLKDLIKTGGEWVDSLQLEELVATSTGVAEAAVVAVPDARWGERPLAVVVAKPGAELSLEILNVAINAAVANGTVTRYAKLERFELVEQLPRTSVGKVDKKLQIGRAHV